MTLGGGDCTPSIQPSLENRDEEEGEEWVEEEGEGDVDVEGDKGGKDSCNSSASWSTEDSHVETLVDLDLCLRKTLKRARALLDFAFSVSGLIQPSVSTESGISRSPSSLTEILEGYESANA